MEKDENGNKENIDREYIEMIIKNLNDAIENNYEFIHVGYFFEEEEIKFYNVAKEDWYKVIEIVMDGAIQIEEYELCSELQKIKEKI